MAAPWRILIFFVLRPFAKLDGFMLLYIVFCPSTVIKLDMNLPIISTNLQNAAPRVPPTASGVPWVSCYATAPCEDASSDSGSPMHTSAHDLATEPPAMCSNDVGPAAQGSNALQNVSGSPSAATCHASRL